VGLTVFISFWELTMRENFLTIAKYNEDTNKTIAKILDNLSNEDREKNRKSYYGSLSGLFRHIMGAPVYILSLCIEAVENNAEALKALAPLAKFKDFKGKLTEDQWKQLVSFSKIVDKAYVNFVSALNENDFNVPVKLSWYKGKPASVPLRFMLQQLTVHNVHHRGQISQILDSLKIENDFSGINIKFL
jgi:uncharacterized damage-inducible protein DinB